MQNYKRFCELERREKSMVDTDIRPAYVDVAEVCRDWGCSRSKG